MTSVDTSGDIKGRLGPAGRAWRTMVLFGLVGTLFWNSCYGEDDDFPLGPMTQFAFYVQSSGGQINSRWLEADTAAGEHLKLSFNASGSGLKRAEVEGQAGLIERDPSLLQGIADRLNQGRSGPSRLTRIYVVHQTKTLDRGRVVRTVQRNQAVWDVR
ncbi:MAG: hypothetical protein ABIS86_02705 [Streptosporangiaceae bacterium]